MIAAVKIISIGFDIDRKKIRNAPNFVQFWGYVLCPGNVIMGPWCAYNDYLNLFNRNKWVRVFYKSFFFKYVIAMHEINVFVSFDFSHLSGYSKCF